MAAKNKPAFAAFLYEWGTEQNNEDPQSLQPIESGDEMQEVLGRLRWAQLCWVQNYFVI